MQHEKKKITMKKSHQLQFPSSNMAFLPLVLSVNTLPSTPTFSISVENVSEKEIQVTENDLKLINDVLEKVLGAENGCNDSLSGKPFEGI
ncbi:hypothetical protein Vadar_021258 [Vaccinium darrowii]|uniref:Uncharacterized protein n=1 Tax=Vaccinium darrowii TaxID=229202 RepID=A0ACB7Y8R0_9ERIC|nr:hypothetical protein Vadar_021258 [Vaccinium darrowii]